MFATSIRRALFVSVCVLLFAYLIVLVQTFDEELGRCFSVNPPDIKAASDQYSARSEILWHMAGCTNHPFMPIGSVSAFLGVGTLAR
jgi:hypothetical protein